MAEGLASFLGNKWLQMFSGTAFTAPTSVWIGLHIGNPGASGTSNLSSVTTRMAVTWGTAAAGAIAESNTPTWSSWAGTNGEVVTDISCWDASTAGNFYFSALLASSKTMATGDALQLTTLSVSFTPIAA